MLLAPLLHGGTCAAIVDNGRVTLRNDSDGDIHILAPGESFSSATLLAPGQTREIIQFRGTRTFRAVENGNVLLTQPCEVPSATDQGARLTVAYTGTELQCIVP